MAEDKKINLSVRIARRVFLLGGRILSAKPERIVMLQSALIVYNQAQMISGSNAKEAKKLLTLAKRIEKKDVRK